MKDEHETLENKTEETRDSQDAPRPGLLRKISIALILLGLIIGGIFSLKWVIWRMEHATTNAAFVKADIADVAPEIPGKILSIEVREGQKVQAGDLLLKIDPAQNQRQLEAARAALEQSESEIARRQQDLALASREIPAAVRAAEAALEASRSEQGKAEANLQHWEKQHQRFQRLLKEKAISASKFEEVETAWASARSAVEAVEAQISLREAQLEQAKATRARIGASKAGLKEAESGHSRAEAALKLAQLARSRCQLRAPISGVVARILVDPGDFATPGRPALGIYDPSTLYVEARFEETKLRYLHQDKELQLKIDALPHKVFRGHVAQMAPASSAEFALIPRDITAGEFTKITQRVPIRIALDDPTDLLLPGLSVEVAVSKR